MLRRKELTTRRDFPSFVKHSSIRILLALVAHMNMELVQLDVKTNFFTW